MFIHAGRWKREVQNAEKMLQSSEKAQEDISRNIALLEDAVSKDSERLEGLRMASDVEHETLLPVVAFLWCIAFLS